MSLEEKRTYLTNALQDFKIGYVYSEDDLKEALKEERLLLGEYIAGRITYEEFVRERTKIFGEGLL